jgi:hypothetical protein
MEKIVRLSRSRPVNYPPASVVLALFVVLSVFASGVYLLVFYLK